MVSADIQNVQNLDISAREIVKQLPNGRGDWEAKVPAEVSKKIIEKGLFGYKD